MPFSNIFAFIHLNPLIILPPPPKKNSQAYILSISDWQAENETEFIPFCWSHFEFPKMLISKKKKKS